MPSDVNNGQLITAAQSCMVAPSRHWDDISGAWNVSIWKGFRCSMRRVSVSSWRMVATAPVETSDALTVVVDHVCRFSERTVGVDTSESGLTA